MKIKIEFAKKEVKALQEAGAEYFAREGEWNNMVGIKGNNPAKINKDTLYWEKSGNEDGSAEIQIEINKDWAVKAIRVWTSKFNAIMNFVLTVAPAVRLFMPRMKESDKELNELAEDLIDIE